MGIRICFVTIWHINFQKKSDPVFKKIRVTKSKGIFPPWGFNFLHG